MKKKIEPEKIEVKFRNQIIEPQIVQDEEGIISYITLSGRMDIQEVWLWILSFVVFAEAIWILLLSF